MNTVQWPCADDNLRKAISYATNYDAIIDAAGYADLMIGPLPIGILGFNPDLDVYRMELDRAKEYLAKTSQPDGGTLRMVHFSGLEQQPRWALIMLDSLKQLNIGLDIQPLNWPDMVALCQSPKSFSGLFPVYQTANYGDPDNIAFAAYHSSRNGIWQNPVYKNPEVDALIEAGRAEIDPDKRMAIYGDFQKKVVEDAPDIFDVLERRKLGMRDAVQGYRDRSLDTRLGTLNLRVPKLRQGSYFPGFLEARKTSEQALVAVIQEAWISGVSTRRVDDLVQALGLSGISKSTVSKLCKEIDERVGEFLNRPLTGDWPYVWLDATYLKVRQGGRIVRLRP